MRWCKIAAVIVFGTMGANFIYIFVFFDFAVMSTQGSQFLPNSAEWTIWPKPPFSRPTMEPTPPLTTATYFSDGAICAAYGDVWVDDPVDRNVTIQAFDASDSRRAVPVKPERKPDLVSLKQVCTEVLAGSTKGSLPTS